MTDSNIPEIMTWQQAKELGLKKYYTGKPCINGHLSHRRICKGRREGSCCQCRSEKAVPKYHSDKDKFLNECRKSRKKNYRNWLITSAKNRAKQKNIEFSLTNEDITLHKNCPVCNKEMIPQIGTKEKRQKDLSPSLDRVDNSKGYIKGNVEVICWRCNTIKGNASSMELRMIADWIDSFLKK